MKFGVMKSYVRTSYYVSHMEKDLQDSKKILFSDWNAMKLTAEVRTDTLVRLAHPSGYAEGVGNSARFNRILGFAQINETSVVMATIIALGF